MSSYVLTYRQKRQGMTLLDGSILQPVTLTDMTKDDVECMAIRLGRRSVALADLFEITVDDSLPGHRLTIQNAPPLHRLGASMRGGELVIDGDVADDLGASMRAGIIRVRGRAGHRVGGPDRSEQMGMSGGELLIERGCGDDLGLKMRRGMIAVRGRIGAFPGYRMIAGTIVIDDEHATINNIDAPTDHKLVPGLEMKRGSILLFNQQRTIDGSLHLNAVGEFAFESMPVICTIARRLDELGWLDKMPAPTDCFRLFCGDATELNRGEIWQKVSRV